MKVVFLIPPSEGKLAGGAAKHEKRSYQFALPLKIAKHASEKDLKCSGKRYEESKKLHFQMSIEPFMLAIERYNGEMYKAMGYTHMTHKQKDFFHSHFLIVSGMYGLVSPTDTIANYKLPIECKGLYDFWGNTLSKTLLHDYDLIIDLLPNSYAKLFDTKLLHKKRIRVEFYTDEICTKKLGHSVKKIKGELIQKICLGKLIDIKKIMKIELPKTFLKIQTYEKRT